MAREKSPYLLQHQYNPVDWYPWGNEAFSRARSERKPIFLSVGYSTCHWCHVMERESFEDREVAAFLNAHFIAIKVDREERPDIDRVYMTFVQTSTGQGGWPMTVFLTPELKPFFGGTYFPPRDQHGRPGFLTLLRHIQRLWQTQPGDLVTAAAEFHRQLADHLARQPDPAASLSPELLERAATGFKAEYDPEFGGFGHAPKFPRPSQPAFLLWYGTRRGDAEAVDMVLHTCERMAAGGIHDQLGGGFARYAVDAHWLVPHFEKMLYDNAQLVQLYLDAYLVSGRPLLADVARGTLRYVLRDMTHAEGGFFSAEDADSEGKEGKFYCWARSEVRALLTEAEFAVVDRYFGLTEQGNFVDHSDPDPLPNQNVLSVAHPELNSADAVLLAQARDKLLAARSRRTRPQRDDKILSSWNGLMLGAMARGGIVLGMPEFLAAANRNLQFIRRHLWDASTKTLFHRWREGERDSVQLLDAYAFMLAGALDLYEAELEPEILAFACALAEGMLERFHDPEHGGFWQTTPVASDVILRVKEDYDGAEPSGNSVACASLLRLAALTDRAEFLQAAQRTLALFADRLHRLPQALPVMLRALAFSLDEPKRIVVTSSRDRRATGQLLAKIHSVYQPHKVVIAAPAPAGAADDAPPQACVCTGKVCRAPTDDWATLKRYLE